jgi:integrase
MRYIKKLTPAFATKLSQQSTDTYIKVTDTVIPGFKLRLYKMGQTRYIPLNDEAFNVLQTWKRQTARNVGYVFIGKNGKRFTNIDKA